MDPRIPHSFGSAFLLAGALAIGWVLHQSLVQGSMAITSPAAVLVTLAGVALIAGGRALERRFDPSEFVADAGGEDEEEEEEFDEEFSPLSEADLEGYERDDPDG